MKNIRQKIYAYGILRFRFLWLTPCFFIIVLYWGVSSQVRAAVTWEQILTQAAAPPADNRFKYGRVSLHQYGDLRLPPGNGPFPVAVVIHGGCWSSEYTQRDIANLSAALTRKGIATWTLEFRRVGNIGGGWPGTFLDVAGGTDFLHSIAAEYSLDLDRVIAVGHSSGGHLALWLGLRHNLPASSELYAPDPLRLRGVVSLAGITDIRTYGAGAGVCNRAVTALMGGPARRAPGRYRQANPVDLLPAGIPVVLLYGSSDTIVAPGQSRVFARAARNSGDEVELLALKRAGHFDLIATFSEHWRTVEREIVKLLQINGSHADNVP